MRNPFKNPDGATAEPIVTACLPASHYVDLANAVAAVAGLLGWMRLPRPRAESC